MTVHREPSENMTADSVCNKTTAARPKSIRIQLRQNQMTPLRLDLKQISDEELISSTRVALASENRATFVVLRHFQEIDERRLYAERSPSLFAWATEELGLSNGRAQRRIDGARMLREFPELTQKIMDGDLALSHLSEARSFFRSEKKIGNPLSREEKLEVLAALERTSTRETERYLLHRSSNPSLFKRKSRERRLKDGGTSLTVEFDEGTMRDLKQIRDLW